MIVIIFSSFTQKYTPPFFLKQHPHHLSVGVVFYFYQLKVDTHEGASLKVHWLCCDIKSKDIRLTK